MPRYPQASRGQPMGRFIRADWYNDTLRAITDTKNHQFTTGPRGSSRAENIRIMCLNNTGQRIARHQPVGISRLHWQPSDVDYNTEKSVIWEDNWLPVVERIESDWKIAVAAESVGDETAGWFVIAGMTPCYMKSWYNSNGTPITQDYAYLQENTSWLTEDPTRGIPVVVNAVQPFGGGDPGLGIVSLPNTPMASAGPYSNDATSHVDSAIGHRILNGVFELTATLTEGVGQATAELITEVGPGGRAIDGSLGYRDIEVLSPSKSSGGSIYRGVVGARGSCTWYHDDVYMITGMQCPNTT